MSKAILPPKPTSLIPTQQSAVASAHLGSVNFPLCRLHRFYTLPLPNHLSITWPNQSCNELALLSLAHQSIFSWCSSISPPGSPRVTVAISRLGMIRANQHTSAIWLTRTTVSGTRTILVSRYHHQPRWNIARWRIADPQTHWASWIEYLYFPFKIYSVMFCRRGHHAFWLFNTLGIFFFQTWEEWIRCGVRPGIGKIFTSSCCWDGFSLWTFLLCSFYLFRALYPVELFLFDRSFLRNPPCQHLRYLFFILRGMWGLAGLVTSFCTRDFHVQLYTLYVNVRLNTHFVI